MAKITFGTASDKVTYVSAGLVNNGKTFTANVAYQSKEQGFSL